MFGEVVNRDDVGMLQAGDDLGLTLEPGDETPVLYKSLMLTLMATMRLSLA